MTLGAGKGVGFLAPGVQNLREHMELLQIPITPTNNFILNLKMNGHTITLATAHP
jgi:hypothetical protein